MLSVILSSHALPIKAFLLFKKRKKERERKEGRKEGKKEGKKEGRTGSL